MINGQLKILKENFRKELFFSTWFHFDKRKKHIVFQRIMPDTSCLCEIYENVALIARGVRKDKSGYPTNLHDIAVRNSCDSSDTDCIKTHVMNTGPKNVNVEVH